ncbi:MAG: hypothetical protein C0467_25530 [Planctomycetaceae bacterium]|nr:hypothetical protein [Planctomycetaceae bacterium]
MRTTPAVLCSLVVALCTGLGAQTATAQQPQPLAVQFADVDVEKSLLTLNGKSEVPAAGVLRAVLSLPGAPKEAFGTKQVEAWELQIVFKKPLAVGTAVFLSATHRGTAAILRPDYEGELAKATEADWLPIGPSRVLEPGARVRAVRLTGRQTHWHMHWVRCLLITPRFDSVTSEAVGSGEPGPFGSHPNSIPRGEAWVNAAPDPNPGAAKQVPRGPVSDALPSWYILSWDKPQTLRGLRIICNAEKYTLAVYRGDPKQNPALAGPKDWESVPLDVAIEVHDRVSDRFIPLATETLAVRLTMTKTHGGPIASIERFDALTDLGDRVVTVRKGELAPFPIAYEQPFDGMMAMSIVDGAGKPVRTLVAQVDRKKGPQIESWNLRDDDGNIVPPGEYRWKAITAPPLDLRYQFSVYPNVANNQPDRLPWLTGESGPNGWLADHSSPSSGAARGDKVYFAAPWVESGVSLIECDQTGKKLWARHSFAGFSGPDYVAAETDAVYILCRDKLERMDPVTHEWTKLGSVSRPGRGGAVTGMAAAGGKLFVAFHGADPAFENAARAGDVDIERCLPLYPDRIADPTGQRRVAPNPRAEFLRLLRLTGSPSGQNYPSKEHREGHFPIDLETVGDSREQFILVAFKTAVPLGSIVFPCPGPDYRVEFAALKADAAYPANPKDANAWTPFAAKPTAGWVCVAAPPETTTRALRVRVTKAGDAKTADDPLTDLLDTKPKTDVPNIDGGLGGKKDPSGVGGPPKAEWFARIEGLRMLRRRFEPVAETRVRVNSGAVSKDGVWDAARTEPLSSEKPGVYVVEWDKVQAVSGLAIKEIDGARTEIDVWDGPAAGPVTLDGPTGWKQVAVYNQSRRDSYEPGFERNDCARYLDGMVDFGGPVTTRAVRLRVVSQWTDNGERGTASGPRHAGARSLDLRRCKVHGLLALKPLGGEPALDPIANRRIEVRDGKTGELKKELPLSAGVGLVVGPAGELYTVQSGRVVQIDAETGTAKPVLPAVDGTAIKAARVAVGPEGNLFVHVLPEHLVRVYKPNGDLVRAIGKPGGQRPGPWDPEKFAAISALVVDGRSGLWVVENQDKPRRIVQYGPDGAFVAEHLGNTNYGGGGVLDRFDKSRLFFGRVQFEIDWKTGKSRVKNLLADHMPDDLVPVRFRNRTYLASAPLSHQPTMSAALIYLLDEASGTARPVAAFGEAENVELLNVTAVLAKLAPGKVPANYTFLWTDRNGDGKASPDEVEWELKPADAGRTNLGRFNEAFRLRAGSWVYEPTEVLANGVPVFLKKVAPAPGLYELTDGRVLAMNERDKSTGRDGAPSHTVVRAPDGKPVWKYATSYSGVSGLFLPPWRPGYVTNEFGVIGHETETRGDLGEFFVTSGNNGRWNLWTSDGFLAGQVLRHKLDPRGRDLNTFRDGSRGADLNDLTGGQEHFHAFFTRTDTDGKTYIVHGHNLIAVTEVLGLDRFKRLSGAITVSADDIRRVRAWDTEQARKEVKSRARVAECVLTKSATPLEASSMEGAKLALGYDDKFLYAKWTVENQGQLKNAGTDFHRYFKTGAYVDLMLGTDPAADGTRQGPTRGDVRVLITVVDGKPQVVLYQAVAPGGAAGDAWETSTPAAGTTKFDRVVRFPEAVVAVRLTNGGGYTVEAVLPLATLGLKPADGVHLRFDWGVQSTDDGASAKRRAYWSNVLANGTTDEAIEARLEPHLWGTLAFALKSAEERRLDDKTTPGRDPKNDLDSILDGLKKKP